MKFDAKVWTYLKLENDRNLKSEFEVWSRSLNIFEAEENKWLGVWWWEMRTVKYYKIQKTKDDKSGESDTVRTSSVDIQSQQIWNA